ncbi:MAG TPA: DedA family protein [Vicinamibacteria bacterium]|nr:DedA family protein [Vicinamibacteria bacterium]
MVDRFLEWVAGLPQPGVYAVLVGLSAIENVFPPAPADVAVVLGAFLSQRGYGSAWALGTMCWAANLASSAGMFFYARALGRSFFDHHWVKRLMPPSAVQALEKGYARHGLWAIFFSRFLPGLRAAVTPFAGLLGVSPLRALLPAAAASAIWYTFLVVLGTTLGLNWERAKSVVGDANRVLAVLSVVVFGAVVAWLWRHRHRAHE